MLKKWAVKTNNMTAMEELNLINIPFTKPDDLFYSQKWLFIHNGVDFAKKKILNLLITKWLAIWFPMWKKSVEGSLFNTLPEIDTPVYFIEGNGDKQKSHYLVEDYYKFVKSTEKGNVLDEKSRTYHFLIQNQINYKK